MRVHRLELTAFGPFAGTEVIDFEPLNRAGVFLLTGQTGAGKTSVLDAICFGLFGQVPGVRDKAKSYRSHHAPDDRVPRVVLEVTLRGRKLRITRQPPWSRASRRARSGVVDEKARASVEERVGSGWVVRSTRADEVGHLVTALLGLNRDQFCQVVLLAQGEFQTFLRAGATDRQRILETLFGTQRFLALERWLAEHRREQTRRHQAQLDAVELLAARLHEVCSPVHPAETFGLPPDLAADCAELLAATRRLSLAGARTVDQARARLDDALTAAKHAQHAYDEARSAAELRHRYVDALRRHDELVAATDIVTARERQVARAREAVALIPLVHLAREAAEAAAAATHVVARARDRCTTLGRGQAVPAAVRRLQDRVARLRELSTVERECDSLRRSLTIEAARREQLDAQVDELRAKLDAQPAALRTILVELEREASVVARGAHARERLSAAEQALTGAQQAAVLDIDRATLDSRLHAAAADALLATELWLDAKERLLAGIAAELAGSLTDGVGCPVCGSESHPSPATPTPTHVSAQQEADLYARVADARANVADIEKLVDDNSSKQEGAFRASLGRSVREAQQAVEAVRIDAAAASAGERRMAELTKQRKRIELESTSTRTELDSALSEAAAVGERLDSLRERFRSGARHLTAAVGADTRVTVALDEARRELRLCRALERAVVAETYAAAAAEDAEHRLTAALGESDFRTAGDALDAALTRPEMATMEALNQAHAADLEICLRDLGDPLLASAAIGPEADLPALAAAAQSAQAAAGGAQSLDEAVQRRQTRLEQLLAELEHGVAALVPLRTAKDLADQVAGICAGSSPDNPTRTALSSYVLAARLSQVVAAANSRLEGICSGRYQLGHTLTRGAGDTRGGLGLVVHDTHTDRNRDPATLSGGETFYVSLSLALGLADVVTGEAGDAELATLFVDEGFGGLDDETREEVLDELDALRSGGRTIGLVSHLMEMRSRIPTQLHVVAGPRGSTCRPVGVP